MTLIEAFEGLERMKDQILPGQDLSHLVGPYRITLSRIVEGKENPLEEMFGERMAGY